MSIFRTFRNVIALGAIVSATAFAQMDELSQLAANRDKKLASPFLQCASWTTSFDEARAAAKASGMPILGYFTRSYAPCGPCMQLEQGVLAKPEFIEFSKSVVLFCHISTRIPSEANSFLFAEKGGSAFPTLMVLDAEGNVLARQCGERSMRAIREVVAEGQALACLIHRAATGDAETRYHCLSKRIELGHLAPDVARAQVKELGRLSADRRSRIEAAITSCECSLALLEIRKARDDAGRLLAAGRLLEMKNAGRIPSDGNVFPFWEWLMTYAAHTRDVKLFEDGLVATRLLLPNDADTRERLQEKENTLERMKREIRLGAAGIVEVR